MALGLDKEEDLGLFLVDPSSPPCYRIGIIVLGIVHFCPLKIRSEVQQIIRIIRSDVHRSVVRKEMPDCFLLYLPFLLSDRSKDILVIFVDVIYLGAEEGIGLAPSETDLFPVYEIISRKSWTFLLFRLIEIRFLFVPLLRSKEDMGIAIGIDNIVGIGSEMYRTLEEECLFLGILVRNDDRQIDDVLGSRFFCR